VAVVRPLRGLRYDAARAGDPGLLLAPPYDVVTPREQAELQARSPYNVIRLILPEEADRGAAAARTLREWVECGLLVRDPTPEAGKRAAALRASLQALPFHAASKTAVGLRGVPLRAVVRAPLRNLHDDERVEVERIVREWRG